jgi:hypothetical protein
MCKTNESASRCAAAGAGRFAAAGARSFAAADERGVAPPPQAKLGVASLSRSGAVPGGAPGGSALPERRTSPLRNRRTADRARLARLPSRARRKALLRGASSEAYTTTQAAFA